MIAAVLAGGKARRFGGEKLLYKVSGKPLILHTIGRVLRAEKIEEVVIVTSRGKQEIFEKLGFRVITDELEVGPAGGVYAALHKLGDAFVIAGDMPLVQPEFVDYIVEKFHKLKPHVCVPKWENGYLEPLHAAYSKSFLEILEKQIAKGRYMLNEAIRLSKPCYIKIETLPEAWRESFFNVNTKSDLKKIKGFSRV
ncbi:molybdenum cofactor guanylyltransferase MobA [Thermococcus aggregans]|uniref:Probable molybdenum cofactor guanylyltransferase n=1 Tax=Thermococcus aggregans TaxID=110163 RepID=A0A9E7MWX5_THEAG|nr:molybdenum cofactor guanylyltransferase MobA [Thermococcus aggregans]USS40428.1 molybdenum cofactor guanylyltransferase MobA [Thermococcus aggregans]